MWKNIRRTLIIALVALVIIQFISIDKENPPDDPSLDFISIENPPANVTLILRNACYDCHSYDTKYPWYTNVQPIAWWVKGHVKEGRKHLNFAEWATYDEKKADHKIEEMIEEIEERNMPLKSFTWVHEEAKLDREEINATISWLKSIRK